MVCPIVSLDDRILVHRIGVVDDEQMAAIGEMLCELLGLDNLWDPCLPSRTSGEGG